MSKIDKASIPAGWATTKLGDLAHFINGKTFKSSDWRSTGIPIIRIQNLNHSDLPFNYISEDFHVEEQFIINKGDLLFAWSGTPGTSFGAHIWQGARAYLNQHIFKVITFTGIDKKFLYYLLNHLVKDFVAKSQGTAGLSHITKKEFEATTCLLPPVSQQIRIVEKIEEFFSDLDQSCSTLKIAEKQTELYKHVILKDAFQGNLTKGQNKNDGADISKISIKEINISKQKQYSQITERWNLENKKSLKNGKKSNHPIKPKQLKNIPPFTKKELAELPEIPKNWIWAKVNDVTLGVEYGSSTKSQKKGLVPVLRMGNIQNFFINWSSLVYTSDKVEINKYLLKKGDVLFNRTNSPELVGKSALYRGEQKAIYAGYLIKLNILNEIITGEYLNYYLNSPFARSHGAKIRTDAVNQSNINGEKLVNYPLPICTINEQLKIVEEIEYRFTIVENLRETIYTNLNKIQLFKHIILNKAFKGALIPENIVDESASLLLENIRLEKEKYFIKQKELTMKKSKTAKTLPAKKSIRRIIELAGKPISAKEVWLNSEYSNNIEGFYAELKVLSDQIIEIKKDTESLLTLRHANR